MKKYSLQVTEQLIKTKQKDGNVTVLLWKH